jgi:hypothetical protein
LLFLLYFVQFILKTREDKREILAAARTGFMENIKESLTTFSVEITEAINPNKDCFNMQNIIPSIEAQGINVEELLIKNDNDDTLNYKKSGQGLLIYTGTGFSGFLKFYYSNAITRSYCPSCDMTGCQPIPQSKYTMTPIKQYETNSITAIEDLLSLSYGDLRSIVGIPAGNEVKFIFEKDDGSTIEGGMFDVPKQANVYSEKVHLIYLDTDGIKKVGFLTVMVW